MKWLRLPNMRKIPALSLGRDTKGHLVKKSNKCCGGAHL